MANLKSLDIKDLEKSIHDAEDRSLQAVKSVAKEALECIREAAAALQAMPHATADLVVNAEIFLVKEIEVPRYNTESEVSVHVGLSNCNGVQMTGHGEMPRPVVKAGRYRAMFVLVALDEKKR